MFCHGTSTYIKHLWDPGEIFYSKEILQSRLGPVLN